MKKFKVALGILKYDSIFAEDIEKNFFVVLDINLSESYAYMTRNKKCNLGHLVQKFRFYREIPEDVMEHIFKLQKSKDNENFSLAISIIKTFKLIKDEV